MALRIRYARDPGETLAYSVERLSDGAFWGGPSANSFGTTGATSAGVVTPLPPSPASGLAGRYGVTIPDAITATWADGNYCVNVHNAAGAVIACLGAALHGGDDGPFFPPAANLSGMAFSGKFQ